MPEPQTMHTCEFMTASEKHIVLRAWRIFLKYGLRFDHFTDRLYKHLTLHCSFIAHYDRSGFYSVYFTTGDDRKRFFQQFDPDGDGVSIEYGMCWWLSGDYADINQAMREEVRPYLASLMRDAADSQRTADLAQASALLAKHGIEFKEDQ